MTFEHASEENCKSSYDGSMRWRAEVHPCLVLDAGSDGLISAADGGLHLGQNLWSEHVAAHPDSSQVC
jgi:hypothetical protein